MKRQWCTAFQTDRANLPCFLTPPRPPVRCSPPAPPHSLASPTAVPPTKINKGTINKNYIFFIHRGVREDRRGGPGPPRVRASSISPFFSPSLFLSIYLLFLFYPRPTRPRASPLRFSCFPFFFFLFFAMRVVRAFLLFKGGRRERYCSGRGNMGEFGY